MKGQNSFIHPKFIEHVPCARHCAERKGYKNRTWVAQSGRKVNIQTKHTCDYRTMFKLLRISKEEGDPLSYKGGRLGPLNE